MGRTFDCALPRQRERGLAAAESAVRRGQLVVVPTDTLYGVAADAFDLGAVAELRAAKGRGPDLPTPVLVPDVPTLDGLATGISGAVRELVEAFWPGGLTVLVRAQPTLSWDLGGAAGADAPVALRMPLHPVALELLARTGPLATSSAGIGHEPVASDAAAAQAMFGDTVAVYLDGGTVADPVASTIVDGSGEVLRLVREGAVSAALLREVVPTGWEDDPVASDSVAPSDPVAGDSVPGDPVPAGRGEATPA